MKFPESLLIRALDTASGLPISNVALCMILKATHKNDYCVGPKITDDNGEVRFFRADCEASIQRAQEMFVMDYVGDLASCGSRIEIRLHLPEAISRMIQQFNQMPDFWGRGFLEADHLHRALREARNARYEPMSVSVHQDDLLVVPDVCIHLMAKAN